MVRTSVLAKLRMRKQKIKTTVPLDVVPERRTERCSPRFRPGDRFCELRFRYQSSPTGREGEISRPLDHMWQIPFIHSTRFITSINFYIYSTASQLFLPCATLKCVRVQHFWQLRVRSCRNTPIMVQKHYLSHLVFHMVRAGTYRHEINGIYTCALSIISCRPIYLFVYLFSHPVHSVQQFEWSYSLFDPCLSPRDPTQI